PESKQAEKSFETLFASALLINLVSEVEHFFVSCAATAICLYPGKIGNETFRLVDVLAATSSDELIERAANRALQSLMYEKPADYLSGLCEIVSIDRTQLSVYWPEFVELKARRDLGVHNNWIANEVYLRKLKEIDYSVLPPISTNLSPDFAYLNTALDSCGHLIGEMANLMAKKWLPKLEAQAHAKGSAHAEIPQSGNAS
ncbi:MAG: hypothetical protein IH617_00260, partial [Hydrogenophaga sp.]|nr:hypothetical protein [Hydrogenophaga sp.]